MPLSHVRYKKLCRNTKKCVREQKLSALELILRFFAVWYAARDISIFSLCFCWTSSLFFIAMLKSNNSRRDIARIYLILPVKANNSGSKCILSTRTHREAFIIQNLILLAFHSCNQRYLCSSYKLHAFISIPGEISFPSSASLRFPVSRRVDDRRRKMFARINRKSCSGMRDEKNILHSSDFFHLSLRTSRASSCYHVYASEVLLWSCMCAGIVVL